METTASGIHIRPTDKRECEVCDYEGGDCKLVATIVMCPVCLEKEIQADKMIVATAAERVAKTREPLNSKAEYFNARTQSIIERRKVIDSDTSIKDKSWHEATELMEWLNKSKTALFSLREQEQNLVDEQNAIQVRLNTVANQLRKEQQEELKLKDLTYQPIQIKKPSAPRVTKPAKFDKVALENASAKHSIPAAILQVICVQKKCTIEDAVKHYISAMNATKK
jgi:hypothetical protein